MVSVIHNARQGLLTGALAGALFFFSFVILISEMVDLLMLP